MINLLAEQRQKQKDAVDCRNLASLDTRHSVRPDRLRVGGVLDRRTHVQADYYRLGGFRGVVFYRE